MAILNQLYRYFLLQTQNMGQTLMGRDSRSKNISQLEQHAHCWFTDTAYLIVRFTYLAPIPPISLNSNIPKT